MAANDCFRRRLPCFVEPAEEEALLSWLLRLATRLQVSLHVLARESFGIDDPTGASRWWFRPPIGVLQRISERTELTVARLQRMTLARFHRACRDDEAHARFAGERYAGSLGARWAHRFAICARCLRQDATPYLRKPWLIGWMAVCPTHTTRLIDRCSRCRAPLLPTPFTQTVLFSPAHCARCGRSFLLEPQTSANPSVTRLQAALLEAKFQGFADLAGLGRLTWRELVGLADVLLGMAWSALAPPEREHLFKQYMVDPAGTLRDELRIDDCRHDSLRFLAWFLEGWPRSCGARWARKMLVRWLEEPHFRRPNCLRGEDIEPDIQQRLTQLVGSGPPDPFLRFRSHSRNLEPAPGN